MKRREIKILDTAALIHDPDYIIKASGREMVIPVAVIKQLDGLKNSDRQAVCLAARKVSNYLDWISTRGDIRKGVELSSGSSIRIYAGSMHIEDLASRADNRIVGAGMMIKKKTGIKPTLVTTDTNMRIIARVRGLAADVPLIWPNKQASAEVVAQTSAMAEEWAQRGALGYIGWSMLVMVALFVIIVLAT